MSTTTVEKNIDMAYELAHETMTEHNIKEWRFVVTDSLKHNVLGLTNYTTQTVSLNRHYAENASWDSVRDTVLHEFAHVLAGRGTGHGLKWKSVALSIGANPKASHSVGEKGYMPKTKYTLECDNHGDLAFRSRKTATAYKCVKCQAPVKWRQNW